MVLDLNDIGDEGIVGLLYIFRSFYCKLGCFDLGRNIISWNSIIIVSEVLKSFFCYLEYLCLKDLWLNELFEIKKSFWVSKLIDKV